jgi:hypothetical protein
MVTLAPKGTVSERVAFAGKLAKSGQYDPRSPAGLTLLVIGALVEVAHKLQERPDLVASLPGVLQQVLQWLLMLEPFAEMLIVVGGGMAAQGARLLPRAPRPEDPTVFDDETGGHAEREVVR